MVEKTEKLYMELSALENRGVTIWLEGTPSDSLNVSNQLSIHEDTSYMRDYVFEEGRYILTRFLNNHGFFCHSLLL